MNSKRIIIVTSALTVIAGMIYWIMVFSGAFPVDELVPGYRNWFLSFPLADGWMFSCAIVAAVTASKNNPLAVIFAPAAGSSMIFLGLYAFAYGANTGLLFNLDAPEIIEIVIKIYCLTAGSLLIYHGWKLSGSRH